MKDFLTLLISLSGGVIQHENGLTLCHMAWMSVPLTSKTVAYRTLFLSCLVLWCVSRGYSLFLRFHEHHKEQILCDANVCAELHVEEPVNLSNATCSSILDSVAPLRTECTESSHQLCLNEAAHVLRCECRRTERKWKKDKLQVSLILCDCLSEYQTTVKAAKSAFLISSNTRAPSSF